MKVHDGLHVEGTGSILVGSTGVDPVVHGVHVRPASMGSRIQLLEKNKMHDLGVEPRSFPLIQTPHLIRTPESKSEAILP